MQTAFTESASEEEIAAADHVVDHDSGGDISCPACGASAQAESEHCPDCGLRIG